MQKVASKLSGSLFTHFEFAPPVNEIICVSCPLLNHRHLDSIIVVIVIIIISVKIATTTITTKFQRLVSSLFLLIALRESGDIQQRFSRRLCYPRQLWSAFFLL